MRTIHHIFKTVKNGLFLKAHCGPIGIGLIGIGGWGASNAINIMRTQRFNIIGVHDIRTELAHKFASRFKTNHYDHLHDLLKNPKIHAVSITVPNQFHSDMVKLAADAGKHIFVEKPLASSPDSCKELGLYCRETHVILQVGHQLRRDPVFREINLILESGALCRPMFTRMLVHLTRRGRGGVA